MKSNNRLPYASRVLYTMGPLEPASSGQRVLPCTCRSLELTSGSLLSGAHSLYAKCKGEIFLKNVAIGRIFLITLFYCDPDRMTHDKGSCKILLLSLQSLLSVYWYLLSFNANWQIQVCINSALFYSFIIYNPPASKVIFQRLAKKDLRTHSYPSRNEEPKPWIY